VSAFEVTRRELDSGEIVIEDQRVPVDVLVMTDGGIEDPSLTDLLDPGDGIVIILPVSCPSL
jgi:hypothetical protein